MRAIGKIIAVSACSLWLASCSLFISTFFVVRVSEIALEPSSVYLPVGSSLSLVPAINPSNATIKAVSWTSSNSGVASVSAAGIVTAIAAGEATITVKTEDENRTATCKITVGSLSGISLNASSRNLAAGDTFQLTASPTGVDVAWASDNESVAKVSATGLVTAVAAGAATISATSAVGGYVASCGVAVEVLRLTGLGLSAGTMWPVLNESIGRYVVELPADATQITVTPSSSSGSITLGGQAVNSGSAGDQVITGVTTVIPIVLTSASGKTTRTYDLVVKRNTLLGYWKLQENLSDSSDNGYDGQWKGVSSAYPLSYAMEDGKKGVHFRVTETEPSHDPNHEPATDVGDHLIVPLASAPELLVSNVLSLSFWMFWDTDNFDNFSAGPPATTDNACMNIVNQAVWTEYGWQIREELIGGNHQILFWSHRIDAGVCNTVILSNVDQYKGEWVNIVVAIDNLNRNIATYVDGALVSTASYAYSFIPVLSDYPPSDYNRGDFSIGAFSHAWGGYPVNGKMRRVRIYHNLLDADDAAWIYANDGNDANG